MTDTHVPVFTTRVTAEEMAEQSKRATAEGMKELAAAMANKRTFVKAANSMDDADFISDSNSDYDSDYVPNKIYENCRKNFRTSNIDAIGTYLGEMNASSEIKKLENRIHYINLDLTNAKVEVDEANAKIEELNTQMVPYKRANDELIFLKSSITRALKDTGHMNMLQLELRFKIFYEEANEHAVLCNAAVTKIDLNEVRMGMLRVLNAERKRITQLERSFKLLIMKARIKEVLIKVTSFFGIAVVILAIIYKLVQIYA